MKAYRFRFEKLLKSKKMILEDISAKTARAQKILLTEKRKLQLLQEGCSECVGHLEVLQVGNIDAHEIERAYRYLHLLHDAADQQAALIKEVELRVEMLRKMLIETEKEKKILEKLDEREQEAYLREYLQKEQAVLDEVGINKHVQRNALHYARTEQHS
jgi:flagellar FliJ protein